MDNTTIDEDKVAETKASTNTTLYLKKAIVIPAGTAFRPTPAKREYGSGHFETTLGLTKDSYGKLTYSMEDDRGRLQEWFGTKVEAESVVSFGMALDALKAGKRVRRAGWNGKGMYLWLLPAAMVKAEWCREPHLKAVAEANGGEIEALGSIRMMTADKKVLTGWLASQTDMLAEDWVILS